MNGGRSEPSVHTSPYVILNEVKNLRRPFAAAQGDIFRFALSALLAAAFVIATSVPAFAGALTTNSTQPGQLVDKFEPPGVCSRCHSDPIRDWSGSMMGNDFRDPSFLSMLSIAEQDAPGVGDYCLRCHGAGWFEGKSEPPRGDFLGKAFQPPPAIDQESIPLCDFCHRIERVGMVASRYDGRPVAEGNGSVYLRPDDPWKGGPHPLTPLHKQGEFCGSCHDVSNPGLQSSNDPSQVQPLERTYSEWKFSDFGENGITCQNCHPPMKFPGAQTWLLYPGMAEIFPSVDAGWTAAGYPLPEDRAYAWKISGERNEQFMRRAADVEILGPTEFKSARTASLKVRVTNNTGHKLPTGFAEGRHMWLHIRVTDARGRLVFEDGKLDAEGGLVKSAQTKVYEQKGAEGGRKSFHFAKLDNILKDNRIPPRGFNKKAYDAQGAYIIGADYKDGQSWDITRYSLPVPADARAPFTVTATLDYETYSKEFIDWLLAEDKTAGANVAGPALATPDGSRTWAETTAKLWRRHAKGRPVLMASESVVIPLADEGSLVGLLPVAAAIILALASAVIGLRGRARHGPRTESREP